MISNEKQISPQEFPMFPKISIEFPIFPKEFPKFQCFWTYFGSASTGVGWATLARSWNSARFLMRIQLKSSRKERAGLQIGFWWVSNKNPLKILKK